MKASKIIFFLVLVFFLGGLSYFAWQVWQKRYDYFFQGNQLENVQEEVTPTSSINPSFLVTPTPSFLENSEMTEEKAIIQDILDNHCSQNCRRKTDVAEKKYCLEICGLNPLADEFSKESDCKELDGQAADICWKNLAIKEKSGIYCDKIKDEGIKESCQNRLVEEFLK